MSGGLILRGPQQRRKSGHRRWSESGRKRSIPILLERVGPRNCEVIHRTRTHKNPEASTGDDIAGRLL
jgi:hypothetical protein